MSIGQPCKHCAHGKMRPIHFSWDQAVVLCDNNKCKSILDVAPSECIIKRDFLHSARQPFSSEFGLQDLSESSSGVYSETRSSLPSPAQSRKSVTDEEVESLLKASYAPLSFKDCIPSSSESSGSVNHTQVSSKVQHTDSDQCRYDGFFELLNDLDLEPPVQPLNTESQSQSTTLETGLEVVTTELEGWLEDFDFPTHSPLSGDQRSDQAVRATSAMVTTNLQGPSIPSQSSAFSPVDTSKEEYVTLINNEQNSLVNVMSYHTSFVENSETSKYISQQCENSCFSTQFENEFMKKSMSDFHTRFVSPTASAASEDSGYNEEDGKASTGLELVMDEENLKISPQTMHSSLKNIDNTFRNKLITQAHQNNFKNFIQDKLEWPAVSNIHTLTVLPAMVTTEKNFVDNHREQSRSSSVAQASDSSGICTAAQDGRGGIDFSTEQQNETSQIPSGLFQGIEYRTGSSGNCESVVTDESHAISIAELSHASVLSQRSECIVSEESSHSTFSETRNKLSENVDSASGLNTSCMTPLCYGDGKSKRERLERSKSKKFRESGDSNTRNYVPPDKSQFPDPNVSLVRDRGKGRGRKKGKGKDKAGKSKRKSKRLTSIKGRKQAPSKKLSKSRQTKRPGIANKVLPRSARRHASFLKDQLSSSSGKNQIGANAAEELHGGDDNIYYLSTTAQNSGWQTSEGETNHHSQRASNLSPRKHLMGQVNEDPWSVIDLCLEELAIEVVVQGDQREMSRHPGNAAKHDVQLQQMMSLFCKEGKSEESHFPASSAAQDFPSKVCDVTLLETKNGELPFKEKYSEGNDIKEKKINKDYNKCLNENSEQNTQDLRKHSDAKNLKETEQDLGIDSFLRIGSRHINSQFNVINECKGHTSVVQENARLHQRPSPNGENPSAKLAMKSGENEGSKSLIKEEKGLIKQQLVTNNCEDCQYTPSEEKIHDEISAEDLQITGNMKPSFDKELAETGNGSIRTEKSEKMEYLFTSINQDVAEKSAFESIKRECISENYSALKSLKVSHKYLQLNEVCDENMPMKSENVLTEKLNVDISETNTQEQSCNVEVDNISESASTSPEASPQYFPNPPKCETIRNWIGYKDEMSVQGNECCVEEEIIENSSLKYCPDLKSRFSSSKYFQSLVKDMDFDEDFFQCPVREHPSKTFSEHLKSSLFFGETAGNSPSHIGLSEEVPLDFKYKDRSQSDCVSKSFPQVYDQHLADSKTSAVYTQALVPSSSSIAQDPVTSVATDISSCKAPPIVREKLLGEKILIVPHNSQLRYIVTSPVMNSNSAEQILSSSRQPFQNFLPKFLDVGSSGEGIGGKKPDCVSESREHDSKWGNYIFAKSTEQRLSCAPEFTGLSGAGVRKKQGNNSNSENIKSISDSEDISALSHSPVDTADKESRLGVSIKTEWTSKSFPANFTGVPSLNSVSSMQTSLNYCLDRVNEDCETCDYNSGHDKQKIELDMHCKEQASCTRDFLSDSDSSVDANKLSVISLDSDDEIHGTVLGRASECGFTSQTEKDSSCVTSDEKYLTESYFMNDVLANQCNLNAESAEATFNPSEMKDPKASLTQVVSCGSKRKADDQNEALKKQRLHDMFTDIQTEEYTHKHKIQSAADSNSQCGSVMCGILDHSILHDEHCCSSSHQDFQDFVAPRKIEGKSPPPVKAYAGPSKHCGSNKCGSNYDVSNILRACVAKESIENYYSVCSSAKEITSYTFQDTTAFSHDFQFGCMKTGPQFDSSSCLKIEKEVNDLDFFQLDSLYSGFLVPLISSTESHVSTPEPVQEQSYLEHCTLQESCASKEHREKKTTSEETSEQEGSVLNEMKKNPSNHASKPNNDNSEDKNVYMSPLAASHTSGTNLMSRNLSKFAASFKEAKPLVKLICNDNIIFTEHGENYNHSIPYNTSVDIHTSQQHKKIYLFRKSSQSSQLVSSHQSDASEKNSCITSLLSVPSMSSGASSRLGACGPHLKNECVTDAVVPHSHLLFPALHSSQNMAPCAWAMASSSFACRDKATIHLGSSDIQKQTSVIDYQIPASTHPPTVVPPPLVGSNAEFPLTSRTPISLNCMKYNISELPAQSEKKPDTQEDSSMLKKVKLGSTGFFYLRPTPALKNAISEMRKKENTEDKEEEKSSSGYLTLPDGNPIPPPIFIPSKKNEVQLARHKRKRARKRFNKKVKDFVEEKVKESLESSRKNEIPKIIVIYTRGNLHLCEIDVAEDR